MNHTPIEFWFDFSSGYAYFAAHAIDRVGERHDRGVLWRPYMLGVAFKRTGSRGLSGTPIKGDYARRDWARLSEITGLPFQPPSNHPITALPASRAYYWIEENFPDLAHEFARRAFRAYFGEGRDMTSAAKVAEVATGLGISAADIEAGVSDPLIKERVKERTEEALSKGVFGSPFFLVGEEPFWGWDRLSMLEEWLEHGRWRRASNEGDEVAPR